MSSTPKISIIIPTYNQEKFIGRCIRSLLAQSLPSENFEIIVIDDGSTDNTYLVVKEIQKTNLSIIIQKHKKNVGYGGAIKAGFKLASKKYAMWIPGDNSHQGKEITKIIEKLNSF